MLPGNIFNSVRTLYVALGFILEMNAKASRLLQTRCFPARRSLSRSRRVPALMAGGGRTREYWAPIGLGSRGAWRLVLAPALLEGSAQVGSAFAEGGACGGFGASKRASCPAWDGGRTLWHKLPFALVSQTCMYSLVLAVKSAGEGSYKSLA